VSASTFVTSPHTRQQIPGALATKVFQRQTQQVRVGAGGPVYRTLGARLDVVEMMDGLMQGADRDLVKIWQKMNAKRFDNIMLKTKTVGAKATPAGIEVTFESAELGGAAPEPQTYDLVLQAVGRTPNGKKIAVDKAGVAVTDRGFIKVDIQMRTNVPHIFAIGDIVGQPMLAHKAVHEAHVAAEVIAGELQVAEHAWKKQCKPGPLGSFSLRFMPLACPRCQRSHCHQKILTPGSQSVPFVCRVFQQLRFAQWT
jgi:hypothetical protein